MPLEAKIKSQILNAFVNYLSLPLPLQKGESADPSSKSCKISCFPTSESPTSKTFKR